MAAERAVAGGQAEQQAVPIVGCQHRQAARIAAEVEMQAAGAGRGGVQQRVGGDIEQRQRRPGQAGVIALEIGVGRVTVPPVPARNPSKMSRKSMRPAPE